MTTPEKGRSPSPRPSWWGRVLQSAVVRSVVRIPPSDTPSGRALHAFSNVFLHVYPVRVPRALLRFRSTWRLGFISSVLFALLFITGLYLMFFYTPSVNIAYGDMQQLRAQVGFGQLIRNVHRWGAHLMVLAVILHLVRVFIDGAYKAPRQFNWVIGVGLLVVTLAYSFTGYLLPWDQLAYWAVTVGSGLVKYAPGVGNVMRDFLLGGETIGQAALLRFYVIHVAVLTVAFAMLIAVHLWRLRKDGLAVGEPPYAHDVTQRVEERVEERVDAGAVPAFHSDQLLPDGRRVLGVIRSDEVPAKVRDPETEIFTWPALIIRHQVIALAVCALVLALGIAFEAPLRDIANPSLTPEPSKAPWYFVGLQELLAHFDPLVAGVLAPGALIVALVALPYVDRNPSRTPRDRKVAVLLFWMIFLALVVLTIIGAFFRGPGWGFVLPWEHLYFEP
ncbi:MAG: cytochrome b N-terminal domain-containing protein [Gemmatimonadaceae bacterium]|nr:cytochrome b N-terminal domain-containing protein [Gemmatimonadaceae bacterium]